jgi:ubiquinol-cytochrome c reductase cytochrome b subunit
VGTALTGYLSQQNFDSQWISTQAKDGINATGAGAFFNVLNFGQMLMWHIMLLPLIVSFIVAIHVLLVRIRGVVPPFAESSEGS